jgi:hypothetical protein
MYRRNQFHGKVKATSTGKLLDSLSRNNAVAGKFNVAYYQHYHHIGISCVFEHYFIMAFMLEENRKLEYYEQ